jgi:hypothetical protein
MSYKHSGMPPVIRRTKESHYQLETSDGTVISEYNYSEMNHPGDWWSDLVEAMKTNYSDPLNLMHDLTLLSAKRDWAINDETTQ